MPVIPAPRKLRKENLKFEVSEPRLYSEILCKKKIEASRCIWIMGQQGPWTVPSFQECQEGTLSTQLLPTPQRQLFTPNEAQRGRTPEDRTVTYIHIQDK